MLLKSPRINRLLHPISYKNISISCAAIIAVAAKNYFLSIRAKHGESIKRFFCRYFLQVAAIFIYNKQVKGKTSFTLVVTCKNNSFIIRHKSRSPVSITKTCYLIYIYHLHSSLPYLPCLCSRSYRLCNIRL